MLDSNLLGFGEADLTTNRAGRISERQRQQLNDQGKQLSFLYGTLYTVVVGGFFITVFSETHGWTPATLLIGGLVGLALGAVVAFTTWQPYSLDLAEGIVESIQGRVALNLAAFWPRSRPTLWVQEKRFEITRKIGSAFEEDRRYRIYFAPNTNTILSAQLLED